MDNETNQQQNHYKYALGKGLNIKNKQTMHPKSAQPWEIFKFHHLVKLDNLQYMNLIELKKVKDANKQRS